MRSIFWFRRDLRLHDNTGLYHALSGEFPVVPIFIFDTDILEQLKDKTDARVTFIHNQLELLNKALVEKGSALQVYFGKPIRVFEKLLRDKTFSRVYLNHDYELCSVERDLEIKKLCSQKNVEFASFKDQVIFEKSEIVKSDSSPYTVFTAYKNKWLTSFSDDCARKKNSAALTSNFDRTVTSNLLSLDEIGFAKSSITVPQARLTKALLFDYAKLRNLPSQNSTSRVGVHLRFGTVSVRECVRLARKTSDVWLSELIWREFFMQTLFHFSKNTSQPAKLKFSKIKWRNNRSDFQKWCEGKTGFPLVDAGMRELNKTGFMHNRVRMVAASFLVKNLLIDYRWGEDYFAAKLLDFELASNNGNWQWVAGTGCDAAPYFRIFNPEAQLKRFDPELKYVRKWLPELNSRDYPSPIIDFAESRKTTLEAYAKAAADQRHS